MNVYLDRSKSCLTSEWMKEFGLTAALQVVYNAHGLSMGNTSHHAEHDFQHLEKSDSSNHSFRTANSFAVHVVQLSMSQRAPLGQTISWLAALCELVFGRLQGRKKTPRNLKNDRVAEHDPPWQRMAKKKHNRREATMATYQKLTRHRSTSLRRCRDKKRALVAAPSKEIRSHHDMRRLVHNTLCDSFRPGNLFIVSYSLDTSNLIHDSLMAAFLRHS